MANQQYLLQRNNTVPNTGASKVSYYICDTDAGKPVTGLNVGDLAWAVDTGKLYVAISATAWGRSTEVGTGADPPAAGQMGKVDRLNQNAAIGGSNQLTDTAVGGMFEISYLIYCSLGAAAAGTIQFDLTYNFLSGSTTESSAAVSMVTSGNHAQGVFVAFAPTSTDLYFTTTLSGIMSTALYGLRVRCKFLG